MRRKLLVRGTLTLAAVGFVTVASLQGRVKSADQTFIEMYERVPIGSSLWEVENRHGFPQPRPANDVDLAAIHNALHARWKDDAYWDEMARSVSRLSKKDRDVWFDYMRSRHVEWWVWEHPYDPGRWIAVANLKYGPLSSKIIDKLRCGF